MGFATIGLTSGDIVVVVLLMSVEALLTRGAFPQALITRQVTRTLIKKPNFEVLIILFLLDSMKFGLD